MYAYHEGGQVNIEIRDDGKGINPGKVKAKAVEKGLITADQAAQLSDRDSLQLIFHAGLSTADQITNISGRGVGMDVVKTNIERIGGALVLQSEVGKGTTVQIKIPLTLAIIPALMVESMDERYAIPQVSLVELVRIEGGEAGTAIESILGTAVYRLRGRLLPLVRLSAMIEREQNVDGNESVNIVVLQADGQQFGLIVDRVSDSQEIVVKPLGSHLNRIPIFAGATIMGDGKVALILDVLGLARAAKVFSNSRERGFSARGPAQKSGLGEQKRLLVFTLDEDHRVAIDLSTVGRLEKISRDRIEYVGDSEVVQYRGGIMSLLNVAECLGYGNENDDGESVQIIVYTEGDRNVGLIVGQIVDIVEDTFVLEAEGTRPGVRGRAVVQDRVTELVDVPELVRLHAPRMELAC
jgi:two-component system chemotaxis sensor kinase CheA